jgi:hypothetical protein
VGQLAESRRLDAVADLWVHRRRECATIADQVGIAVEELRPKESRFFLRHALGMFVDLSHEDGHDVGLALRKSLGTSLFVCLLFRPPPCPAERLSQADDTMIAPRANKPCLISAVELESYFVPAGVVLPDFVNTRLMTLLDSHLTGPLSRTRLEGALSTAALWVCGCQRIFARLSTGLSCLFIHLSSLGSRVDTFPRSLPHPLDPSLQRSPGRKPGAPSVLPALQYLYSLIDEIHAAIQRLQQFLVNISHVPAGCEDDPFALDHFVLLGVRADTYLVDVVNLIHEFLMKERVDTGSGAWAEKEGDPVLQALRRESELRVRKCLKLTA